MKRKVMRHVVEFIRPEGSGLSLSRRCPRPDCGLDWSQWVSRPGCGDTLEAAAGVIVHCAGPAALGFDASYYPGRIARLGLLEVEPGPWFGGDPIARGRYLGAYCAGCGLALKEALRESRSCRIAEEEGEGPDLLALRDPFLSPDSRPPRR